MKFECPKQTILYKDRVVVTMYVTKPKTHNYVRRLGCKRYRGGVFEKNLKLRKSAKAMIESTNAMQKLRA